MLSQLEVARIIGEPKDPRKPYPNLIENICEIDTANPEDYIYYFDAIQDTDKVYVITSTGEVTQENVTPDTPTQITFADAASPEYYIKITDLLSKKEDVLARKNKTINRALNAYEIQTVIGLMSTAASGVSHTNTLGSGYTRFSFPHLIDMLEQVQDYGDNYTLVLGATVDKDIKLWDWNDNKYHSLKEALEDLNIERVRISLAGSAAQYTKDGAATDVLAANTAYLVAKDTEMGKPLLFVRKKLDTVKALGGVIAEGQPAPERYVFMSPNPITVTGSARYLAVGVTGFEEIAAAVVNPYALSRFIRS